MTCSECKFMWCWLCEGEYSDIHYIHGQCKGLQFANINYLNEVYDEKALQRRRFNENGRERGCCCCVDNIESKLNFIGDTFVFGYYHGNHLLELFVSLFVLIFLCIPMHAITMFYGFNEQNPRVLNNCIIRKISLLLAVTQFIIYQHFLSCLLLIYAILTLPFSELSIIGIIRHENERAFEEY